MEWFLGGSFVHIIFLSAQRVYIHGTIAFGTNPAVSLLAAWPCYYDGSFVCSLGLSIKYSALRKYAVNHHIVVCPPFSSFATKFLVLHPILGSTRPFYSKQLHSPAGMTSTNDPTRSVPFVLVILGTAETCYGSRSCLFFSSWRRSTSLANMVSECNKQDVGQRTQIIQLQFGISGSSYHTTNFHHAAKVINMPLSYRQHNRKEANRPSIGRCTPVVSFLCTATNGGRYTAGAHNGLELRQQLKVNCSSLFIAKVRRTHIHQVRNKWCSPCMYLSNLVFSNSLPFRRRAADDAEADFLCLGSV